VLSSSSAVYAFHVYWCHSQQNVSGRTSMTCTFFENFFFYSSMKFLLESCTCYSQFCIKWLPCHLGGVGTWCCMSVDWSCIDICSRHAIHSCWVLLSMDRWWVPHKLYMRWILQYVTCFRRTSMTCTFMGKKLFQLFNEILFSVLYLLFSILHHITALPAWGGGGVGVYLLCMSVDWSCVDTCNRQGIDSCWVLLPIDQC
jgi:hypothetical protein